MHAKGNSMKHTNWLMGLALIAGLHHIAFGIPPNTTPPPELALVVAHLDLSASGTFVNGQRTAPPTNGVAFSLGLTATAPTLAGIQGWSAGAANQNKPVKFQYLVAFTQPRLIGSIFLGTPFQVAVPKDDARPPYDPNNTNQWRVLTVLKPQPATRLISLPVDFQTPAILFTETRTQGRSLLANVRLYQPRLANLAPLGIANADSEYTAHPHQAPPYTYRARSLIEASGAWQNAGPNNEKRITHAPLDVAPSWFFLSWLEPQPLVGLYLEDNITKFELSSYAGPAGVNPAVAPEKDWARIRQLTVIPAAGGRQIFFPSTLTRGLRLKIMDSAANPVATISALHAYTDLGTAPAPESTTLGDHAPFTIPYTLPEHRRQRPV